MNWNDFPNNTGIMWSALESLLSKTGENTTINCMINEFNLQLNYTLVFVLNSRIIWKIFFSLF